MRPAAAAPAASAACTPAAPRTVAAQAAPRQRLPAVAPAIPLDLRRL